MKHGKAVWGRRRPPPAGSERWARMRRWPAVPRGGGRVLGGPVGFPFHAAWIRIWPRRVLALEVDADSYNLTAATFNPIEVSRLK